MKEESEAALAAYEKSLAEARNRAQAIGAEIRDKLHAEGEERRKALEAKLNSELAEAEKAIAATKSAAMANVRTIAVDAAGAIVQRLIGTAPAGAGGRGGGRRSPQALRDGRCRFARAETWVAIAFLIFVGILIYVGVPKILTDALDNRAQARAGRARRGAPAEGRGAEAARRIPGASSVRPRPRRPGIIAGAKAEAERIAAEAKAKMEEFVARRTKMAETKIAQAEAQAVADVRAAAAEAAVAAAEKILTD